MKIDYIVIIGFAGQLFFSLRFVIQWIYSEKMKKSVIPSAFWYFSIGGSTLLLVYAILRKDIVFIVGQGSGMIIYLRNIHFVRSEIRQRADAMKNAGGKAVA